MIFIITQRDPFFIDSFLEEFDKFDIPYTVLDLPSFNKGFGAGLKKALLLYGFIGFLKLLGYYLRHRVFFNLNNMVRYEKHQDVESIVPLLKSAKDGDVILSLSAPCRIPSEVISKKTKKLNIHCGKLPRYAGMMPIFWQIFDGSRSVTITIHDLAEEIDMGDILKEHEMELEASLFETSVMAKKLSAKLFHDVLNDQSNDGIPSRDAGTIILSKFPTKQDVSIFKNKMRLV